MTFWWEKTIPWFPKSYSSDLLLEKTVSHEKPLISSKPHQSGSEVQVRYKQTQGKERHFLGIIVGSSGFTNLPILGTSRPLFPFLLLQYLPETYNTVNSVLGRTAFVPPELAKVDIDLIPARDPHSHKATAGQWRRSYVPHQLELSMGSAEQGN